MNRMIVDLEKLRGNLEVIREKISPSEHMLVLKAEAYAQGLEPVASAAAKWGVRWFGAYDSETAVRIRKVVGEGPRIFTWGFGTPDEIVTAVNANSDIGIGSKYWLSQLIENVGQSRPRVHLKIDTGLHRNGILPSEWPAFVEYAAEAEAQGLIEIAGIWSHLAEASDAEDDISKIEFDAAANILEDRIGRRVLRHLTASAASFLRPELRGDICRIGAFASGIAPADGPYEDELGIAPITTLESEIVEVSDSHVTLGIGYGHGLFSTLAERLTINGRLVQRIDADRTRVARWPDARVGQRVAVLGCGADVTFTAASELIDSIGEEVILRISNDVDRVYVG